MHAAQCSSLRLGLRPNVRTAEAAVEQPSCSPACALPVRPARRSRLAVSASTERSNTTTKKRLSGPPGLPPIIDNNSGGGGGGGWDGGKIARNIALNAMFLGIYFLLDSGGPGGIFGGGGGGGGGGGWGWGGFGGGGGGGGGPAGNPTMPEVSVRELDYGEEERKKRRRSKKANGGPQLAPA